MTANTIYTTYSSPLTNDILTDTYTITYPSITTNTGYNYTYDPNSQWPNNNITWQTTTSPILAVDTNSNTSLNVKGDSYFEGDLIVKGKNLLETIDNIEKRLGILHPNKELEEKWEKLKELGEMYRSLEKEILEKENVWKILKK